MKTARTVAAVVGLLLSFTLVAEEAEPASADPADLDVWRNVATGWCLFYNGRTLNTYMTPSCSAEYEGHLWHAHITDEGDSPNDYRIVNTVGGACLAGTGGEVSTFTCDEGYDIQIWELTRYSGGRYTIRNNDDRQCLTSNWADNVYTTTCGTYGDYQLWVRA